MTFIAWPNQPISGSFQAWISRKARWSYSEGDKIRAMIGTSLLRLVGCRKRYDIGFGDNLLIPRFVFDHGGFRGGFQAQVCHFLPKRPYYLDGLAPFPAWSRRWLAKRLFRTFLVLMFIGKPEALKSNRVRLSDECDKYGVPKLDVVYQATEGDRQMQECMVTYGKKILRKCSGLIADVFIDSLPGTTIHYAGTCRMAANRHEGVVDSNLRSFDHQNLFVCDGSVFPDISEKNLTLTIMALAHRLGLYLVRES